MLSLAGKVVIFVLFNVSNLTDQLYRVICHLEQLPTHLRQPVTNFVEIACTSPFVFAYITCLQSSAYIHLWFFFISFLVLNLYIGSESRSGSQI